MILAYISNKVKSLHPKKYRIINNFSFMFTIMTLASDMNEKVYEGGCYYHNICMIMNKTTSDKFKGISWNIYRYMILISKCPIYD